MSQGSRVAGRRGLARNPRLPAELLDRLIAVADEELCDDLADREDLTDRQARALAARGEAVAVRLVRGGRLRAEDFDRPGDDVMLALLDTGGAPAGWARRLAVSPDARVRALLAAARHTPADVLEVLAGDPVVYVVFEVALRSTGSIAERLARHPHASVRRALASNVDAGGEVLAVVAEHGGILACAACSGSGGGWSGQTCDGTHRDAIGGIERAVAANPATPAPTVAVLAGHPSCFTRQYVARRVDLPDGVLRRLAVDPHPLVRAEAAANPVTDEDVLRAMAADPFAMVRRGLGENPYVPIDVLIELAATTRLGSGVLPRVVAATAEELRELATSAVPAARALAARLRPPAGEELVGLLATDRDAAVLVAIAPDPRVPASLLEAMVIRHGARVAEAVARNPACPPEVLLRIATARPPVRAALRRIAGHPNATAEALAACLDDERARPIAASHPALAVETLLGLLDDAPTAAANPALPVRVMQDLTAAW